MKLNEILRKQNANLMSGFLSGLILLFGIFQYAVFYQEASFTQKSLNLWLNENKLKLSESLFVENSLAIKSIITKPPSPESDLNITRIAVMGMSGESLTTDSGSSFHDLDESELGKVGFRTKFFPPAITYFSELQFAGKTQGFLYVESALDRKALLANTALLILLLSGFYLYYLMVQKRFGVLLNRAIIRPITLLSKQMSEGQPASEQDVANSSVEMTALYGEFNGMLSRLKDLSEENARRIKSEVAFEIAKQVAHDIRSPLSALNMVASTLHQVPEDRRILIRNAVSRINDIANTLLSKNVISSQASYGSSSSRQGRSSTQQGRAASQISELNNSAAAQQGGSSSSRQGLASLQRSRASSQKDLTSSQSLDLKNSAASSSNSANTVSAVSIELMPALVDSLVSEKRVQYRDRIGVEIEVDLRDSYGSFAAVNGSEFSVVLSNLINNSVEAFENNTGKVTVGLRGYRDKVEVIIQDNGRGFPPEILNRIGEKGLSYGKSEHPHSGSGLGLYHAMNTIEAWGGQLKVQSQVGMGTLLQIQLPRAEAPSWFVQCLELPQQSTIVIVDDDTSIHSVWEGRIKALSKEGPLLAQRKTFTSAVDFRAWYEENSTAPALYLFDYELLNQNETGLDLIEAFDLAKHSILVTSHYDEADVRERAIKCGVPILQKTMAPFVPIYFTTSSNSETAAN